MLDLRKLSWKPDKGRWAWLPSPVIPTLERWRQEDPEFRSSLYCIASPGTAYDTGYPDSHKPNKIKKPEKGHLLTGGSFVVQACQANSYTPEEQEKEMSLSN